MGTAAGQVHIVSFGSSCFAAAFLRERALRLYAGPFDWVFSSPEMVTHCLQDDFDTFLDTAQYNDCGQIGRASHNVYSEMIGKSTVFNHHDPRLTAHHAYLSRAVDRLRLILSLPTSTRKVFLICSIESRFHLNNTELQNLFQQLRRKTSGFELLAVRLIAGPIDTSGPQSTLVMHESESEGVLHVFEHHMCGGHEGLRFEDSRDEIVFEQMLLPRLDGYTIAGDPLSESLDGSSSVQEVAPRLPSTMLEQPLRSCVINRSPLEVLRAPLLCNSPDLRPVSIDCPVVLKDSVARQILETSGKSKCPEGAARCRRSIIFATESDAACNETEMFDDAFGSGAALLVIPQMAADDADLLATVSLFLHGGPGVRAVLVPEPSVAALRALGPACIVSVQRFRKGSDLFRIADPSRLVAGSFSVRKAPTTSEGFIVLINQHPQELAE